jgi:hypothetical protein
MPRAGASIFEHRNPTTHPVLRLRKGPTMSGHPDRIAEHYRKLAAEEVALAKAAVTNEARAKHYAMAAEYWRLAQTAEDEIIE